MGIRKILICGLALLASTGCFPQETERKSERNGYNVSNPTQEDREKSEESRKNLIRIYHKYYNPGSIILGTMKR